MLDEKDLQAIRAIIKEEVSEAEQRIAKNTVVLLDAEVTPKFNLLAEGIQDIREKMIPVSRIQAMEDDISVLKQAVRAMSQEIAELKKAQ